MKKDEFEGLTFPLVIRPVTSTIAAHLVPVMPLGAPSGILLTPYITMESEPMITEAIKETELEKVIKTIREETGIIQKQQLEFDFETYEIEDEEDFL